MLYNTFIIINNNWKRAMSNGQNNIVVDEQGAKNLQQAKDDNKIAGITETLANGDNQKVSEEQKTKENNQQITADTKIKMDIKNKGNSEDKDKKPEQINFVRIVKDLDTNALKIGAGQCATMAANALLGFPNPIGLMICVAIAFKKLTASTKDMEVKLGMDKIAKNENDKPKPIGMKIRNINSDMAREILGENNPAKFELDKEDPRKIVCDVNGEMLDKIAGLFNEEEQKKCAETGIVEINKEQAKELNNIFKCNTIKAGTLDFNDEKSINNLLGNESPKIIKELKSALNPKINERILQTQQTSVRRVTVEGRGA